MPCLTLGKAQPMALAGAGHSWSGLTHIQYKDLLVL